MKKIVLLFIILLPFGVFPQNKMSEVTLLNTMALVADQIIGQDQFGFTYYSTNNVFYKMKDGISFEYKNISLGTITKVDIKNPLRILLYYENFNTVILLDNQLNEIQKINFSETNNSLLVSKIGIASQNQLWVFNELLQQIGLYDYLKNEYKSISTPLTVKIKKYQTNFNSFEWIDENNIWYRCDLFGKVTKKTKVPDFDQLLLLSDKDLIYAANQQLYHFDGTKNEVSPLKILEKSFTNFDYKDQILSIFTTEGIINYKITRP